MEEWLRVLKVDVMAHSVLTCYKASKGRAVLILCEPIRANEGERAILIKQLKSTLEERDIEVGSISSRGISFAIVLEDAFRKGFKAYIRRVPHNHRKLAMPLVEQEVRVKRPGIGERRRLRLRAIRRAKA